VAWMGRSWGRGELGAAGAEAGLRLG